ncbi:hypothetical protein [Massilia sp. GCM10023247]|uniref:hypothetical protein n=1 Tax=Massilia sp. GCM10023247 TaxID=3252643 RepID=UPI003605B6F1
MIVEPRETDTSHDQQRVDAVVAQGPRGAFAVAGLAVALVLAMWFAFYIFVFLARGGD